VEFALEWWLSTPMITGEPAPAFVRKIHLKLDALRWLAGSTREATCVYNRGYIAYMEIDKTETRTRDQGETV
jgi:hypothetical protein